MNASTIIDEVQRAHPEESPGAQLAQMREKKGYSQEYVAGKLHLRVKVIELLELDNYQQMPEPVFIKGYLRAYANLLDVSPEPLLKAFNQIPRVEKKFEKALWQSRKESHRSERLIRWITAVVAISLLTLVGIWWKKNKETRQIATTAISEQTIANKNNAEIKLTDLSKMQPFLPVSKDKSVISENHED